MRKLLLVTLYTAAGCLAGVVAFFVVAHQAAQVQPAFYAEALKSESDCYIAGRALEAQLLNLHNDARTRESWEASFSQEQVNSWLACEMPHKFPNALPRHVIEPRVAVKHDGLLMAFQWQSSTFSGIISIEASVFCTETPNELAIVLKSVKSGFLPLPIAPWADSIADGFRQAGLPFTWSEHEGRPVALIQLPDTLFGDSRAFYLVDQIKFADRSLHVSGRSQPRVPLAFFSHGGAIVAGHDSIHR